MPAGRVEPRAPNLEIERLSRRSAGHHPYRLVGNDRRLLWRIANLTKGEGCLAPLKQGATHAPEGLKTGEARTDTAHAEPNPGLGAHKAVSKVIYYLAQIVRRGGGQHHGRADLETYVGMLLELSADGRRQDLKTRDNLKQAYEALGDEHAWPGLPKRRARAPNRSAQEVCATSHQASSPGAIARGGRSGYPAVPGDRRPLLIAFGGRAHEL